MDKKGIAAYLAVTFGLGYLIAIPLLAGGSISLTDWNPLSFALFMGVMAVPALGAAAARGVGSGLPKPSLWPLPRGPVIRILILTPIAFAAAHALMAALGFTFPQWNLGPLMAQLDPEGTLAPEAAAAMPPFLLVFGIIVSVVLGATVLALLCVPGEWGWRGYLTRAFEPALGSGAASVLTGVLWSAWLAPFAVAYHLDNGGAWALAGFLPRLVLFCIFFSVVLGDLQRRHRNVGLAALFLGVFLGQAQGMWGYLFPAAAPPWTGPAGWVALGVWACFALAPGMLAGGGAPQEESGAAPAPLPAAGSVPPRSGA